MAKRYFEKYTLRELGLYANRHYQFFTVMKKVQRDKFDYIFSFDDDPKKSINKYRDFVSNVWSGVDEILYSKTNKEIAKALVDIGIRKEYESSIMVASFRRVTNRVIKDEFEVRIDTVRNLDKLCKYFNKE